MFRHIISPEVSLPAADNRQPSSSFVLCHSSSGWGEKKGIAFQKESMPLLWNYSVILIESQVKLRKHACVPSCVWLCSTPWSVAHRLLCPWDFPGKNTGTGCHSLLQGVFPTASPVLAGGFFTTEPPGKPIICLNVCNRPAYGSENKICCWRRDLNVSK